MKVIVIFSINVYQALSRMFHGLSGMPPGSGCRFYPSCSEYTKQMVREKGAVKGLGLGLRQLSRCHPYSR